MRESQYANRASELRAFFQSYKAGAIDRRTGIGNRLREENLGLGVFSYNYWNIANWNLAEGAEPVS